MTKRVKIDVGTVMRKAVWNDMHSIFPCLQTNCGKIDSMSNGIAKVAVRRSERAKENRKRFVGLFRRLLFASIA